MVVHITVESFRKSPLYHTSAFKKLTFEFECMYLFLLKIIQKSKRDVKNYSFSMCRRLVGLPRKIFIREWCPPASQSMPTRQASLSSLCISLAVLASAKTKQQMYKKFKLTRKKIKGAISCLSEGGQV